MYDEEDREYVNMSVSLKGKKYIYVFMMIV